MVGKFDMVDRFDIPDMVGSIDNYHILDMVGRFGILGMVDKFDKEHHRIDNLFGKYFGTLIDKFPRLTRNYFGKYYRLDMVDRFGILGMADSIDILHMVGKFDI